MRRLDWFSRCALGDCPPRVGSLYMEAGAVSLKRHRLTALRSWTYDMLGCQGPLRSPGSSKFLEKAAAWAIP